MIKFYMSEVTGKLGTLQESRSMKSDIIFFATAEAEKGAKEKTQAFC